eukprot:s2472_g8.t1
MDERLAALKAERQSLKRQLKEASREVKAQAASNVIFVCSICVGEAAAAMLQEAKAMNAREARERSQRLQANEQEEYGEGPHDKAGKTHRAQRFAAWLLKTYGEEVLSSGRGVLDVAGGQGDLSWQLSVEYGIPCTLIDPALRRGGALKSWQRRALRKRGREEAFEHFPVSFEEKTFRSGSNQEVLRSASVVVGLHPDEATEAIVDVALAEKRRFAVVPCCVFAERFNHRELSPGVPVRTLNQFCAYLRAKDPRIQEDMLDFEGRNKVLTFNTWRTQGNSPSTKKMRLALALSKLGTEAEALQFGLLQLSRHRRSLQRKEREALLDQNEPDLFYQGLWKSNPASRRRSGAQLLHVALLKCSLVRKAAALSGWSHFCAHCLGADVQQLQKHTESVNADLAAYKRKVEVEGLLRCFVFSLSTAVLLSDCCSSQPRALDSPLGHSTIVISQASCPATSATS